MNFSGNSGEIINTQQIGNFCLTENVYAPQMIIPKHYHQKACFCFIIQGSYTEVFRRKAIEGKPSDLTFHPSGELHSDHFGKTKTRTFIIEFETGWLEQFGKNIIELNEPDCFQSDSLLFLATRLCKESQFLDDFTSLTIEGLMFEMIAEIGRKKMKLSEAKLPHWLKLTRELIDENFTHKLSLPEIAETVGVHPVYLAQMFKKHYQCTIGEFVRRLRIEFASHEISKTEVPLVEIGLASGFAHQAHFSRTFKRLTGFTPAQFRAISRRKP